MEDKIGTFSDKEIKRAMQNDTLVRNGRCSHAKGACYELRLGNVYYDLTENNKRIEVPESGTVLIKPGHRVVLITEEELVLPSDIFARIVSKGSLFSIGLSHVATYADPGFVGQIGIVTQNISDKYIELSSLEPIAKVDFTRLTDPAESTYNGQHGFQMEIWPIKTHLQREFSEVANDNRVNSEEEEAYLLLPDATATMLRYMKRRQRRVDYIIALALIANAFFLFLVNSDFFSATEGLFATVLAGLFVWLSKIHLDREERGKMRN